LKDYECDAMRAQCDYDYDHDYDAEQFLIGTLSSCDPVQYLVPGVTPLLSFH